MDAAQMQIPDGAAARAGAGRRLTEQDIATIVQLLTGTPAPTGLVEGLHARTGGRPKRLLDLMVKASSGRGITVAGLWSGLGKRLRRRRPERALFRREGEYWTITYEGRVARLRHATGLCYLAYLLAHPGQRFHSAELVAQQRPAVRVEAERARLAVTKAIGAAQARIERVLPELGRHLRATLRRGYFCSYAPDPRRVPRWWT